MKIPIDKQLILTAFLCFIVTHGQLINWRDYAEKVARRLIDQIQMRQITGNGMPMDNFNNVINKTEYGLLVEGSLHFSDGFVRRIGSANLKSTSLTSSNGQIQSTVSAQLALNAMELVYDVDYDLAGYREHGTFMLYIPETLFNVYIGKDHQSQVISGSISFLTTGNQNVMITTVHPNNGYTQMVAREMRTVLVFRQNMTDSFNNWNAEWQQALDVALTEIPFPELCFYCPG